MKYTLFWYDFDKMANYDQYFPHNNVENVVKIIKKNTILRVIENINKENQKFLPEMLKSFQSNQANTSYSSKKTLKSKFQNTGTVKSSNEEENQMGYGNNN